jgi:Mg-chelatase subunit ChlD
MAYQYGVGVTPPADRPQQAPLPEDQCGGPLEWDDTPVTAFAPDAIVLVIDRSGSMATRIDADSNFGEGVGESRFEFAKAAARAFADLAVRSSPAPHVGLVSFSTTAASPPEQDIAELIVSGTPGPGQAALSDLKSTIDEMLLLDETAIGLGLDAAQQMLRGSTYMARTVILLSDGQNNRPIPVGNFDPRDVARRMISEDNVRVFTVPTGRSADRSVLADVANSTGGAMLDAPLSDELPSVYAEAFAMANGGSLIFPRDTVRVNASTPCGTEEIPNCEPAFRSRLSSAACACHPVPSRPRPAPSWSKQAPSSSPFSFRCETPTSTPGTRSLGSWTRTASFAWPRLRRRS